MDEVTVTTAGEATLPARRRGRIVVFLLVAVGWVVPSLVAVGLVFIGAIGFGTENGELAGAGDGGGLGIVMVVLGLLVLVAGGTVLLRIATWALADRDQAVAAALVATCWAPAILLLVEVS